MLHRILLAGLLLPYFVLAQLPPEGAQLIKKLPGQQLSVEFVVAKAYQSSDALRAIQAQSVALDSDYWMALAALDPTFEMTGTYSKNRNKEASFFEPRDEKRFKLGAAKYFSTGTQVAIELEELRKTLQPGNFFEPPERTAARLTLSQNLWRDALGVMTRHRLQAGKFASEARRVSLQQDVQDWMLALIESYYAAWLSKSRLLAAKSSLDRQRRLVNVTKIKVNRGTSERPDFLQVESAWLKSQAQFQQSEQNLQQIWQELITNLKLPPEWAQIPAVHIPLGLDKPYEAATALCQEPGNLEKSKELALEQKLWKSRVEASQKAAAASRNGVSPELAVIGAYGSSGSSGPFSERVENTYTAENPQWTVGVTFKMPLDSYKDKAQLARDQSDLHRNESLRDKAHADHINGWLNSCARLKTLLASRDLLDKSAKSLNERSTLEERRFQIGRTSTMNVILASEEFTGAELQLAQVKIDLNQTAWTILKLNGRVEEQLQQMLRQFPGQTF